MFPLFKIRDFGILFNETFGFFKIKGKNFFANYFKSLAILFVVLSVILYFFGNFYYTSFFQSLGSGDFNDAYLSNYYSDNAGTIVLLGILMLLISLAIGAIQISYPVLYLKLLEKDPEKKPTYNEIKKEIWSNIGRVLLFVIISIFFFGILSIIILGICMLLIFVIIGIPLMLIVFPYLMGLFYLTFYQYIIKKEGYFESFSFAFRTINNNFWTIIGSILCISFIINIINYIILMIPYMIFFFAMFAGASGNDVGTEDMGMMAIMLMLIYMIAIITTMLLNNVILINCGLIYYSEREKIENHAAKNDIDLIGQMDE